jgi:hypothetical protein
MNRIPLQYLESDRRRMKASIASRIPEEGIEVVLAVGGEGELSVELYPIQYDDGDWDLRYETDSPEAICLQDIYEHFRRQGMTWLEWQREFDGKNARWRVPALENEIASLQRARGEIATGAKDAIDLVAGSDVADEKKSGIVVEPRYQFQRRGDYWVVHFTTESGTKEGHFRDLEGLRHIAKLFGHPDKSIEGIDLQGLQDSPVANQKMRPQFALDNAGRQSLEKKWPTSSKNWPKRRTHLKS